MNKDDEKVLVVPADIIFQNGRWQGMKQENLDYYLNLIRNNYQFKRRGDVEADPSWQQIIPYIVFSHKDKYFLYKYTQGAGEKRLIDNYIIGVGGHINEIDDESGDILERGMMREWEEEVDFKGNLLDKKLVGVLNDEGNVLMNDEISEGEGFIKEYDLKESGTGQYTFRIQDATGQFDQEVYYDKEDNLSITQMGSTGKYKVVIDNPRNVNISIFDEDQNLLESEKFNSNHRIVKVFNLSDKVDEVQEISFMIKQNNEFLKIATF